MDTTENTTAAPDDAEQKKRDSNQRFGRQIGFGIQQTLACWATDFIDPYVSKWFQNKYGKKEHHVTAAHTWGGEIVGDSAAFFAYILTKRLFSKPVDGVIAVVKRVADPLLSRFGKSAIKPWAEENSIQEGDERYQQKLDSYKAFQAENIVDSTIIATAATGLNVAAQRFMFGNKQGFGIILASKLIGAAATMTTMLGVRTALPTTTRHLDEELSDRYFSKVIQGTKKILGVHDTPELKPITLSTNPSESTLPDILSPEKRQGLLAIVAEHATKIDMNDAEAFARLIKKQKTFYNALMLALDTDGYLLNVMSREHYEVVEKHYKGCFAYDDAAARTRDKEASAKSVSYATAEKRHELKLFLQLMDDPKFLDEVRATVASGKLPQIQNKQLSPADKEELATMLLAASKSAKDPVSAIFDHAEKQVIEYKALAHANEPEGIVTRILASAMKNLLPEASAQDVHNVAKDYMRHYNKDALIMADAFKADSEVVKQSVERAKHLRHKYPVGAATSRAIAT